MLNNMFSDFFAQKNNFLTNIDARIKIFLVFISLSCILVTKNLKFSMIFFILNVILLLSVRIPIKIILLRLIPPFFISIFVLILQTFFNGITPLFELNIFGIYLKGYREGMMHGFLIVTKVMASMSLVIFLGMTTSINKLLSAAHWFKIPKTIVEISLIMYKNIFLLLEDMGTIFYAQRARLGYSNFSRSLRSSSELAGSVLIRAFDSTATTFEAMQIRGYKGETFLMEEKFKIKDILLALSFILFIFLLFKWR